MSSVPISELTEETIRRLVAALDSVTEGELAVDILVACGTRTIPFLSAVLLDGAPQSMSTSRCRVVRALGSLEAKDILLRYLQNWQLPVDPVVAMAEDAVRSAAAKQLLRWPSEELFDVLMMSVRRRASLGLVEALGAFARPAAIPTLFQVLRDDICQNSAKEMLRYTPEHTKRFALRLLSETCSEGDLLPSSLRMFRSILSLLLDIEMSRDEWATVSFCLTWNDAEVVLACAEIGMRIASAKEHSFIISNIFRILPDCNWLQEARAIELFAKHKTIAMLVAERTKEEMESAGTRSNLMNPLWRAIDRILSSEVAWKS